MKLIAPGVHTMTGLLVGRVYLIEDPDGLTLIDASLGTEVSRIVSQIEKMGRSLADVKRILITHAHPDHIGGLPRLKKLTGAEVIVPAGERAVVEGKAPALRPPREKLTGLARLMAGPGGMMAGTPVDRTVSDEELLPEVLGGLVVVSTPGHSPDHMSYWQPGRRILFCGDVMMRLNGLRLPIAAFTVDMDQDRRSIGLLASLEPDVVCFGHGEPLVSQAAQQVKAFAAKVGPA